ncbi:MAG: glycosyltransferase [Candidatus Peribacteria bacterium]|nr:MAG: glycosyltransferase [Candidatus Peribacteria bacterium]
MVYASIVFLIYFSLLLLNKIESGSSDFTLLVREIALQNAPKKKLHGKEVFVIPSYNEGKVIASTVQHIVDAGYKHIVVVNDGSSDATLEVLEPYMKHATVLSHYKNRGQGASLETGFEYVRRYGEVEYVVTFDADGQHDINDLKEFEKYLDHHHGVDVLLGSRFIGKKST